MPKDWVGWVASQRGHTKATKEDKILGNRIQHMERTERRQRRFAVKHLLITRTLLGVSLLVILLMVNFLAGGVVRDRCLAFFNRPVRWVDSNRRLHVSQEVVVEDSAKLVDSQMEADLSPVMSTVTAKVRWLFALQYPMVSCLPLCFSWPRCPSAPCVRLSPEPFSWRSS